MDNQIKGLWLNALKDNKKYPKGKSYLRNRGDTYCCLGVLCDISKKGEWKDLGDCYDYHIHGREKSHTTLPSILTREYEIDFSHLDNLIDINDSTDTFKEVIEYIEKTL